MTTDYARPAGAAVALPKLLVLDLSRVLAAPYCAQILGDLGADVVKIERVGSGDDARHYGVNALPAKDGSRSFDTSFFLSANRNKKSLTLEYSKPEGRKILLDLAARADVLIENFRAGTMKRFGLDYETLRAINPGLIYCSLTGYGQDGPYADRPGYDAVFQAQSGLMNVTGQPAGTPGGEPVKIGPSVVDVMAGMNAAIAVLAALRHRDATGEGQWIDLALLDTAIAAASHAAMEYLISGKTLPRNGNQGNGGAPANLFQCSDKSIYLTAGNEAHYKALCSVLRLPELLTDDRFSTIRKRFENRAVLNPIIAAATQGWPAADLVKALSSAGVPAGIVNDFEGVFADEHVKYREVKIAMPHPVAGEISLIASPLRMSATPPRYTLPPPQLGEHTEEILLEFLKISPSEVTALRDAGII